jgi:hypothetical protein
MEGLRPRAGQGEAAAPPDRPVSPTFRAGVERHEVSPRLVQAGRSPSGRSALALATPVSPTGRVSGAQFACLQPLPKGGRHDCSGNPSKPAATGDDLTAHGAELIVPLNQAQGLAEECEEDPAFGGDHRGAGRLHQGQGGVAAARGRDRAERGGRADGATSSPSERGAVRRFGCWPSARRSSGPIRCG